MNDKKPPTGARPSYVAAEERIEELANAISKYAHSGHYEKIAQWATEIVLQTAICKCVEVERRRTEQSIGE